MKEKYLMTEMNTGQNHSEGRRIPKGNTAAQVNETAYQILQEKLPSSKRVLDLPCGEGEWLGYLTANHPQMLAVGVDVRQDISPVNFQFHCLDATKDPLPGPAYDVVTSISGIVCFGNHLKFFRGVGEVLNSQGLFLVSHDNHWTVRDRLSYLLFGTFKRFPVLYRQGEGNTQVTSIMTVLDTMEKAGFDWQKIVYTSVRFEDLLWVPLAALIWLVQFPALVFSKSRYSSEQRRMIYPFKALYARHYLILAQKKN